jgi:hypothetical protein
MSLTPDSTSRAVRLSFAIPLLFAGLSCLVLPVLDMLPFPGSRQEAFFEWWAPGIVLTWAGLWLLRRGLRSSGKT